MTDFAMPQTHAQTREPADSAAEPGNFSLQGWLVEPSLNQISRLDSSEIRHLEPRLMKLLCHLAAHQGQVVSRDELVAVLWPRVIVNENSLTRAVSELRKHLATPDSPARDYIRTIPKRGYRLTAAVSPARQANESATAMVSPAHWRRPATWLSGATALGLALALSIAAVNPQTQRLPNQIVSAMQDEVVMDTALPAGAEVKLSASWVNELQAGAMKSPVLAADGDRFAYIKQDLGGATIYLGRLSSGKEPLAVFNSQQPLDNLTWSPLGNALLFTREDAVQPAAVFGDDSQSKALYSLDLDTLQIDRLIRESTTPRNAEPPASNLTFNQTPAIPMEPA